MKTIGTIKCALLLFSKQFAAIGGQAVIEGVMMRSPNAFVVAVRRSNGNIVLRLDQWFGPFKKFSWAKLPFIRGIFVLIETMANGIVALNYSVSIALEDSNEGHEHHNDQVSISTYISIFVSFIIGIGLFVFIPHGLTAWIETMVSRSWGLESLEFHLVDGTIKSFLFISYVLFIGLFPDIKKVFQYHGAEHKSISTLESGENLEIANAIKHSTFHPRCGTTFIFFLLFISIIIFALIFSLFPFLNQFNGITKHILAIMFKVLLTVPIAGLSYELIKLVGRYSMTSWGKFLSFPGMLLQKITTRNPDEDQLEVALASIKAVLYLEGKYELKNARERKISHNEIEIKSLDEIEEIAINIEDFLEK